jgi:hypothetical protein
LLTSINSIVGARPLGSPAAAGLVAEANAIVPVGLNWINGLMDCWMNEERRGRLWVLH